MKLFHKPKGRVLLIAISGIAGVIVIALSIMFLYVHSMIRKINIVTADANSTNVNSTNAIQDNEDSRFTEADYTNKQLEKDNNSLDEDNEALVAEDIPEASEYDINYLEEVIHSNIKKSEIKYDKDVFNILLIGSDSRKSGGTGRSDAMIMISINRKVKTITATSILRDIYLKIPGRENSNRINAAFAYGGADLLLDAIEQNFKIKVDKYATIDFYAFIDMVDAIGGISLNITKEDIPVINGYVTEINRLTGKEAGSDCITESGTLLLNGKQALGYSRNRYVGNADFARTARQREILEKIYNKVKKLKISETNNLLNSILPQITTNLKEGEILSLLLSLPSYMKYDIKQSTIPASNTYKNMNIRGMAVLGIDFDKNIKKLYDSIYP